MFSRGDSRSIELLMENVVAFSRATRLFVNPSKCKGFYDGVETVVMTNIIGITLFH